MPDGGEMGGTTDIIVGWSGVVARTWMGRQGSKECDAIHIIPHIMDDFLR